MHSPKPIHPFPARMAPELALRHLKSNSSLRVLDPMVGSGTVVKIAQALGHKALGFDTDPLALLISETWCTSLSPQTLREAAEKLLSQTTNWQSIPASEAYPAKANPETKKFIRFWFDLRSRRQLAALVTKASLVKNRALRLYLLTAISRTIIVKENGVSRAKDVSHSRPHRAYARGPVAPRVAFMSACSKLCSALERGTRPDGTTAVKIRRGDARQLPIQTSSVDVVITSPPYLNAIDYLRGHKLSLVWFGVQIEDIRQLRSKSIGSEVGIDHADPTTDKLLRKVVKKGALTCRQEQIIIRYILDIRKFLQEIKRVLRPGGQCVLVIGDCMIGNTYIGNSKAIDAVAQELGLIPVKTYRRRIPDTRRYLPPPSNKTAGSALQKRMRFEVVLSFAKKSTSNRSQDPAARKTNV